MTLSPTWRRRGLFLALAVALLAAVAFVFLRAGPLAPTRVVLAPVTEGALQPALFGIGTVEARRSYLIGPTAPGRVRAVHVEAGQRVKAGQALAEMEPVDLDARLAALDAAAARAAQLSLAAQALYRDAQAKRTLAQANSQRYADLGAQNFVSAGAVEARVQELASAESAVTASRASWDAARLDQQRIAAEQSAARQQINNVRLVAPADGLVTSRDAEPGSTVVAGQAVLRVVDPATLWLRVRLDQGRSAGLREGLPAHIVLRSQPDRVWPARVVRVEAVSDSVTEERVAMVAFDALPASLSIAEMAEVTVDLPRLDRVLTVPNAAIKRWQGTLGVWTLEADRPRFVAIKAGQSDLDGRTQVVQGLKVGAAVVVHSEKALGPDTRIRVTDRLTEAQP